MSEPNPTDDATAVPKGCRLRDWADSLYEWTTSINGDVGLDSREGEAAFRELALEIFGRQVEKAIADRIEADARERGRLEAIAEAAAGFRAPLASIRRKLWGWVITDAERREASAAIDAFLAATAPADAGKETPC